MTDRSLDETVAEFASGLTAERIPEHVQHQAKRSLLNIIATSFAGCRETAIDKALAVLGPHSAPGDACLIGRSERCDMLLAAFLNAMAANIHDYDDTHLPTIIHPTAPVAPALFALAQDRPIKGMDFIRALVAGMEIECRLGNAISPWHYARGWHITSTCGAIGSAIGCGVLLGLSRQNMVWSIANAAVQASGMVEALGTMSKSISVGGAARGGLIAALLAEADFSGPSTSLGGKYGFLALYGEGARAGALTDGLGESWELEKNAFKPYPVGVVLNPVIDAAFELRRRGVNDPAEIVGIGLHGHPLLRQRTDRADVCTGRLSQVSAQHAITIALMTGTAGVAEFSDAAVARTAGKRPPVTFFDEPDRDPRSVRMEVDMKNGQRHRIEIAGPFHGLSDADLEQKLRINADLAGFSGDLDAITSAVWSLESARDAGHLARICAAGVRTRSPEA